MTTGLAQGLLDGWTTPAACISRNCLATSDRTAKGIRRAGCFFGAAPSVSISMASRSVSPRSLGSKLKASWCSPKKWCSCSVCAAVKSVGLPTISQSFFFLCSTSDLDMRLTDMSVLASWLTPPGRCCSASTRLASTAPPSTEPAST